MSSRANLRAVPSDAPSPAPARRKAPAKRGRGRPRTRLQNALELDERAMLCVLRRQLAADIDSGKGPIAAKAALVRQFREITAEIKAIDEAAAMLDDDNNYGDDDGFDPNEV